MTTYLSRRSLALAFLFTATAVIGAAPAPATGTLYVHMVGDANPGKVHIVVRKASGTKLDQTDITSGQIYDKQFPNLTTGPQEWYVVELSWPASDFHNMSDSSGNIVATGVPATANNRVNSWQVAGTGVNAQVPALMR